MLGEDGFVAPLEAKNLFGETSAAYDFVDLVQNVSACAR
jgi:hypothetical protein